MTNTRIAGSIRLITAVRFVSIVLFIELRDRVEHRRQCTRRLADLDHFDGQFRKDLRRFQARRESLALAHRLHAREHGVADLLRIDSDRAAVSRLGTSGSAAAFSSVDSVRREQSDLVLSARRSRSAAARSAPGPPASRRGSVLVQRINRKDQQRQHRRRSRSRNSG